MKARPEYKHIFSSPTMFYRALHTISSQRYRAPVRRYVIDLFTIELDVDVVKTLLECQESLKLPPDAPEADAPPPRPRVISMIGRPGHNRRVSDSDEESILDDEESSPAIERHPTISLRPVSRIVGFGGGVPNGAGTSG